eukprot:10788542-Karenia_brevis.AAC.1
MDTEPLPTVKERAAVFETSGSSPVRPNRAWNVSILNENDPQPAWTENTGAGRQLLTNTSSPIDVPITDPSVWICEYCNSAYPPHALKEIGLPNLTDVDLENEAWTSTGGAGAVNI